MSALEALRGWSAWSRLRMDDEAEKAGAIRGQELFRARLENIIGLKHPLVRLAHESDWGFFEAAVEPLYAEHGRPGVPVRGCNWHEADDLRPSSDRSDIRETADAIRLVNVQAAAAELHAR